MHFQILYLIELNLDQSKTVNLDQSKTVNLDQSKTVNLDQSKTINLERVYPLLQKGFFLRIV